jgi:hypothetical protein
MQNADVQNEEDQYRILKVPFIQTSSTISLIAKQTAAKWTLQGDLQRT